MFMLVNGKRIDSYFGAMDINTSNARLHLGSSLDGKYYAVGYFDSILICKLSDPADVKNITTKKFA